MWPNLQETADLVTFTEEILNRKLHLLCSVKSINQILIVVFRKLVNLLTHQIDIAFFLRNPADILSRGRLFSELS